jgi:hypothetical protein
MQNIAALAPVVDRIGLMAYDSCPELPCRHSTPEFAAHALQQAIDSGVDASKLMLGIPLYGRVMNNPAEAVPYYDIVKAGKVSDSSDLDAKKRVYFNNKATIGRKNRARGQRWRRRRVLLGGGAGRVERDAVVVGRKLVADTVDELESKDGCC